MQSTQEVALIIGAGDGLSAALARLFAKEGMKVGLVARNIGKLNALKDEINAEVFSCDVSQPDRVMRLFQEVDDRLGCPEIVVYNPSPRTRGALIDLDPMEVAEAIAVGAYGGFLVGQQAARRMLVKGRGAILFTGATASVRGSAKSAPFAMAKFALRGLAQSMARELAPQNIHVAHFILDGMIQSSRLERECPPDAPDSLLYPDAIAQSYLNIAHQHRSAWTWEIELRPWVESF